MEARTDRLLTCLTMLLLANGIVAGAAHAGTASFLCTKARTWLEKTVCNSDHLSVLDLESAVAYARVLKVLSGTDEKAFTIDQNKFWAERNACQKEKDPIDCLASRYETRIAQLKSRPDYPGDEPQFRETFTESLIKESGKGWSQNMSLYMPAIRACVARTAPSPRAVLSVWPEEEGQLLGMRLQNNAGEDFLCVANKDGSQVQVRKREAVETLPEAGPILWLGGAAPKSACGKPVEVLDTDDTPVGWLSEKSC